MVHLNINQAETRQNSIPSLPLGWAWEKLENCIEILDSQRIPINAEEREKRITGKATSELYPYYGATGQVGWIENYLFDEELILLGEDGAPFFESSKNKAYIIKGKSWVNNHAHVLKAIADVTLNQFLCHYLNIFNYNGYVTGTTRAKLNQSPMRKIPIPLPPLPEQRRIVTKIEELFTKIDAGVSALQKTQAQLKRYRQSVLKAACEGKLVPTEAELAHAEGHKYEPADVLLARILKERREKLSKGAKYREPAAPDTNGLPALPEGWCWATIEQLNPAIRTCAYGVLQPGSDIKKGIPLVRVGDIKEGHIEINGMKKIAPQIAEKYSRTKLEGGEVLITLVGAIGRTAVVPQSLAGANTARAVGVIPLNDHVDSSWVNFWFMREEKIIEMTAKAHEVARKTLNLEDVRTTLIALPPLPEQRRIVAEVERRLSVADEVAKQVEQSLAQAQRLRQSILKKAFEGKLVAQDARDEPASVLLERIRQERARMGKNKQKLNSAISYEKLGSPTKRGGYMHPPTSFFLIIYPALASTLIISCSVI